MLDVVWRLWIPGYDIARDGPNRLLGRRWTFIKKRRQVVAKHLFARMHLSGMGTSRPRFPGPLQLVVERRYARRGRELDSDNAVGACKLLQDALVNAGVLAGDDRRVLPRATEVVQRKVAAGEPTGTLVYLRAIA